MLGQTFHIKNSCFRMLPNPTCYRWDNKYFSVGRLLCEFLDQVKRFFKVQSESIERAEELLSLIGNLNPRSFSLRTLDSLHEALDECDSILVRRKREVIQIVRRHLQETLRPRDGSPHFRGVNAASPNDRERVFMESYICIGEKVCDGEGLKSDAQSIWCTLVFRMLCWLLLHDFHEKDVQIPKSELFSNQLLVYIA